MGIQLLLKTQQQEKDEENLKGKLIDLLSTVGDIVNEQESLGTNISFVKSALEETGEKVNLLENKTPELKSLIHEEVNKLEATTKSEVLNIQESNERNKGHILNIQNEIQTVLGNINELQKKMDETFDNAGKEYENNKRDLEEEIKE